MPIYEEPRDVKIAAVTEKTAAKAIGVVADTPSREEAAAKIVADALERKEKRDFWKSVAFCVVAGLPAIIAAWRSGDTFVQSRENAVKMDKLTHQTNAMKDELVSEVRKASRAEGVIEGKAEKANATKEK